MSLPAKTRLKWAISVAILVGVVLVLPGVPIACDWLNDHLWDEEESLMCHGGVNITRVCKGDRLLCVFAYTLACEKTVFWDSRKEALWVDGKNVLFPVGIKVVAIQDDGTVVPIQATQTDVDRVRTGGNPQLRARIVAAVWGPPAAHVSTRPIQ
jgi:hypothetical protein